jgi:spermidine synthase
MTNVEDLVPITLSELDGVRYLHLDSPWVQGAMRIRRPQEVVLEYVQRMLAALLWRPTAALAQGRAVQLGLGAGALTRFTVKALKMPTTVVELHPGVVAANRLRFHLPEGDPRLELVIADAGAWLAQAEPGSASLLQVDLYDHEAAAPVLDDEAFYAGCHRLLEEGGVFAVNLFGRQASFVDSAARIARAFGSTSVWTLRATREGNTVVVASRAAAWPEREERLRRADAIEARFGALGLPARKWLRLVRPYDPALAAHPDQAVTKT